jgi:hypothetical protein
MTIERATELQTIGDLVGAEDLYWSEIENGNEYARLLLAFMFHDAGLLTLAADHYEVLLDTEYRKQAGPQLSSILLSAHRYTEAREVISDLDAKDSLDAIESVEKKTITDQGEYPRAIENLLEEERVLVNQLEAGITLEKQLQLCNIRYILAEYSSRLASGMANIAASTQITLHPGIQVALNKAILAPSRRWFELAHAQTVLFTLTSGANISQEEFKSQVLEAFKSLQMKFLFSGRVLTEDGEDLVVNNLSWGLQQIGNSAGSFLPAEFD